MKTIGVIDVGNQSVAQSICTVALSLGARVVSVNRVSDPSFLYEVWIEHEQAEEKDFRVSLVMAAMDRLRSAKVEKVSEYTWMTERIKDLETQVNIAAGMLSTTEGYVDKHPEFALKKIQEAQAEVKVKDEANARMFGIA